MTAEPTRDVDTDPYATTPGYYLPVKLPHPDPEPGIDTIESVTSGDVRRADFREVRVMFGRRGYDEGDVDDLLDAIVATLRFYEGLDVIATLNEWAVEAAEQERVLAGVRAELALMKRRARRIAAKVDELAANAGG